MDYMVVCKTPEDGSIEKNIYIRSGLTLLLLHKYKATKCSLASNQIFNK